ncbi:hypothetical protein FRC08_002267 [Ceratobasidium sp. 394]|nr:hypothetical protein FRC08_002267 [Ceratobasidium sp. 394]
MPDNPVLIHFPANSFHIIVPSMPAYGFSSPAPVGWNLNKTADLFDTLITKALNYKSYVAAGGDWGSGVTWAIQNNHADNARAVYFPEFYVSTIGNFVYYADHRRGGHFAALDNPGAMISDLRNMMGKWYHE